MAFKQLYYNDILHLQSWDHMPEYKISVKFTCLLFNFFVKWFLYASKTSIDWNSFMLIIFFINRMSYLKKWSMRFLEILVMILL